MGLNWDIFYSVGHALYLKKLPAMENAALKKQLQKIKQEGALALLIQSKRSIFSRKSKGMIFKHFPVHNLALKHKLYVKIDKEYSNAKELKDTLYAFYTVQDREEKIKNFSIHDKVNNIVEMKKELKTSLTQQPMIALFNHSESKLWQAQKTFFAPPLVDHSSDLRLVEVSFTNDTSAMNEVKQVFSAYEVTRVPSWVMFTLKSGRKRPSPALSRFEVFRDKYFLKQMSEGRGEMHASEKDHVQEAFEAFILWGLDRYNNTGKPSNLNVA